MISQAVEYIEFKKYLDLKPSTQIKNELDVIALKNGSIKKHNVERLASEYNLPLKTFINFLSISHRTIQRYASNRSLQPDVADHAIALTKLLIYGNDVFGDKEKFLLWIDSPSKALGGKMPSEIMDSITGLELIKDELARIEYGVYI